MKKTIIGVSVLVLLAVSLSGRGSAVPCLEACSASTNLSFDIQGTPDSRPNTWGDAGAQTNKITFHPPVGYRVRILRVDGDFVAWTRAAPLPGKKAGLLFGLLTTAPGGSQRADYVADDCFLYIQGATDGNPTRAQYDLDTSPGGLLEPDNVLQVRAAVFLSDLGMPVHMEPTMIIRYRFEPER